MHIVKENKSELCRVAGAITSKG